MLTFPKLNMCKKSSSASMMSLKTCPDQVVLVHTDPHIHNGSLQQILAGATNFPPATHRLCGEKQSY